ncbi:MAG: chemotaxis response regulator protein-glutamate methylesterase [Candidatus Methanomethyliaceae archaeon]|nr:chemotaxis response regulator protein-glutamate methylesterase [Candidatus Methanomethyliaceae archaeon]
MSIVGGLCGVSKKARVLVVDDSAIIRLFVKDLLIAEGFEVITAKNGREALEIASKSAFDAAVLDINMPLMDGISLLKEFVRMGIPSVMFSSLTTDSSKVTIEALDIGAIDFVPKPSVDLAMNINSVRKELLDKVKIAIMSKRIPIPRMHLSKRSQVLEIRKEVPAKRAILIAASTGGPSMIKSVLHDLPKQLGAAVLIVQHMPPLFTKAFSESLATFSSIPVKEAEHFEPVYEDNAYVAPGDYHMEVLDDRIFLHKGEKVNFVRPSADLLFFSAAKQFGPKVVAVILSGMGSDGAKGALTVKKAGGHVLVQDESTSIVYGMPKAVVEIGAAEEILPIDKMPKRIVDFLEIM